MRGVIDAFASAPQYVDHLLPIWSALVDRGLAGSFHVAKAIGDRWPGHPTTPPTAPVVAVAAIRDLSRIPPSARVVYVAHGAGQCYGGVPNSLINAVPAQLDRIALAVGPNEAWAQAVRSLGVAAVAVGSPRLDDPPSLPSEPNGRLRVGLAWHWDQHMYPETASAWAEYARSLPDLVERFEVIGSGHPRSLHSSRLRAYQAAGVPVEPDLRRLLSRVDVVSFDSTSAGFEAAAWGWPVVVLDSQRYRPSVSHGLRFWTWADIGPRISERLWWADAIQESYDQRLVFQGERERMARAVFGARDGRAAERAADAIGAAVGVLT